MHNIKSWLRLAFLGFSAFLLSFSTFGGQFGGDNNGGDRTGFIRIDKVWHRPSPEVYKAWFKDVFAYDEIWVIKMCSAPIKNGHRRQLKLDTLTVEIFDIGVLNEMLAKRRESRAEAI